MNKMDQETTAIPSVNQSGSTLAEEHVEAKQNVAKDYERRSSEHEPQQSDLEKVVSEKPSIHHPSQFPDGGIKAWLVVAGGFACLFCGFGW